LIGYKKTRTDDPGTGGVDLIAKRGDELMLVEAKSSNSRSVPRQTRALELARKHGIKTTIL